MKKTKQPGDNISLKTKKTEDPSVMAWINAQTNLMDSLRYLIENEILQHGVRNLQTFIPVERNVLGGGRPAAVTDGIREATEGFEEVSAAASGTPIETPNRNHLLPEEDERIEAVLPNEPKQQVEDEFDEEDIEAWV